MDVKKPKGGSPTHTLPSLSGGDNETDRGSKREEWGEFYSSTGEDPHGKNLSDFKSNQLMPMRFSGSTLCCFIMFKIHTHIQIHIQNT